MEEIVKPKQGEVVARQGVASRANEAILGLVAAIPVSVEPQWSTP
jgi:hypothetical protein